MIDDRSVPIIVFLVVVIVAILGRPVAARSRAIKRRPRTGPESIRQLSEMLGVGIIVQGIDEGPPVTISATLMLDNQIEHIAGSGSTEEEAWEDLVKRVRAWMNRERRTTRNVLGGG